MKKLLLVFAICAMAFNISAQNPTVEGTVKDLKEGKVELEMMFNDGKMFRSETKLKNGKFSLDAPQTTVPVLATLSVEGIRRGIPFFFDGSKVTITIDSVATGRYKITGSKANDQYNALITDCLEEKDEDKYMDCFKEVVQQNSSSIFAPYIVASKLIYYMEYDELDKMLKSFSGDALKSSFYNNLKEDKDKLEKVAVGRKAAKIKQPDTAGVLQDFETLLSTNKYVLIDFWASWCGPCRRENPNIVEAYKTYHSKGFDIFAVSFDTDKARWKKAIADDNLSWTHVSELTGFKNSAAENFFIKGIPANVLIDKNGVIVARNLHGKELQNKLKELIIDNE